MKAVMNHGKHKNQEEKQDGKVHSAQEKEQKGAEEVLCHAAQDMGRAESGDADSAKRKSL